MVFVGVAVSPSMAEVELAAKEGKGTKTSTCCKYGGGFYEITNLTIHVTKVITI